MSDNQIFVGLQEFGWNSKTVLIDRPSLTYLSLTDQEPLNPPRRGAHTCSPSSRGI